MPKSYLDKIENPHEFITAIPSGLTFPELIDVKVNKYSEHINIFTDLIKSSNSSSELLEKIRSGKYPAETRMSLLKMFRRCVSLVCDTEATKKIKTIPTSVFVDNYGDTFKPIDKLKKQFGKISDKDKSVLSVLLGEYDSRGEQGYILTDMFFTWFENKFDDLKIEGPRGAGQDIELSTIFPEFKDTCPCDFIIKDSKNSVLAIGFARYDSTRGGAQSDDRTGGNSDKVTKAKKFANESSISFKIIFLSDGPGLAHKDTWAESCSLDGKWNDNVRVITLSLADKRITKNWLTKS